MLVGSSTHISCGPSGKRLQAKGDEKLIDFKIPHIELNRLQLQLERPLRHITGIKMTRTVPFVKRSASAGPSSSMSTKGVVDLFNVLDFEAPKQEQKDREGIPIPASQRNGVTEENEDNDDDDLTGQELMDFYRDSVLLITGGTGFLGKILLQKLLPTFPIKRIYLLVRKKNTQSVEERLEEFYQDSVSPCATWLPGL